jgi:peptidoglycan/xylan/chitin deacetylase (PgdA/CDA1 family)
MTFPVWKPCVAFYAFLLFRSLLGAQEVALTFDDLPRTGELPHGSTRVEIIKEIVRILQDGKTPPIYGFVNGGKVASAPEELEALKAWTAAGFPLGNHGYSHLNLAETSVRRYTRDISANEPLLRSIAPKQYDWHWFRYPYLEEGETRRKKDAVTAFLKKNHYRIAEVTLDFEDFLWNAPYARCLAKNDTASLDWLKSNYLIAAEERIEFGQKMSQALYGRDIKHIMLLHVGGFETVMLPELLKLLKQKNFKLITLEEAASDPAYKTDHEWATLHGGDFLTLSMNRRGLEIPWHRRFPRAQLASICYGTATHNAVIRQDRAAKPSPQDTPQKTPRSIPTQ